MLHSSLILVQKIIGKSCNDVAPSTGYISGLYNITLEDSVIATVICEVMRDNTSKIIIRGLLQHEVILVLYLTCTKKTIAFFKICEGNSYY